jgi:hypothetical protein
MNRLIALLLLVAACSSATAIAAPTTKQNGGNAVFSDFTSICAITGFASYGYCSGDTAKFTNVSGRIDAVQPKIGRWNLGLTFKNLSPGVSYTLWGNRSGGTPTPGVVHDFFAIGTTVASVNGTLAFTYQTTDPSDLGFDLNTTDPNITLVTSYWSSQWLEILDAAGNLYVP